MEIYVGYFNGERYGVLVPNTLDVKVVFDLLCFNSTIQMQVELSGDSMRLESSRLDIGRNVARDDILFLVFLAYFLRI